MYLLLISDSSIESSEEDVQDREIDIQGMSLSQ